MQCFYWIKFDEILNARLPQKQRKMADDANKNERRVRQNRGPPREGSFRDVVDVDIANVRALEGRTAGVLNCNRFNPNWSLTSLDMHVLDGPQPLGVLLAIILSVNSECATAKTEVQKKYGNVRGVSKTAGYSRRLVGMCLLSKPGSNTFMILQGQGKNENLFSGDLSLRDNGSTRKFNYFFRL